MDDLQDKLTTLRLGEGSAKKKALLYVDALNYGKRFFDVGSSHWTFVRGVSPKVAEFVKAATRAEYSLKIFIDGSSPPGGVADQKWTDRREDEVKKGVRAMPQGFQSMLGDAFTESGVEVHYSSEADCDDTIAYYAEVDGAAVLSGDSDFSRYEGRTYALYKDFSYVGGKLELSNLVTGARFARDLKLLTHAPHTTTTYRLDLIKTAYKRGAPSPLTKQRGNLHIHARPLRQAFYSRMKLVNAVVETFPEWSDEEQKVVWSVEQVIGNPKLDYLLDDPFSAVKHLFPDETSMSAEEAGFKRIDWADHVFAAYSIVCEICSSVQEKSLLSLMNQAGERNSKIVDSCCDEIRPIIYAYQYTCQQCKKKTGMEEGEVEFYKSKNYSMPKRCKVCRSIKKR